MEGWIKKIVDEARSRYGPVEVKRVGNNYYISRVSSVYDPVKKRASDMDPSNLYHFLSSFEE